MTVWKRENKAIVMSYENISSQILKVHYCIHNSLPPVPAVSQINSAQTLLPYLLMINSNITPPSMPHSSKPLPLF